MARRRREGVGKVERMFRIWEYLRKNTDSGHPTTQAEMKNADEVKDYIGNKQTFNRLIRDMAEAMNSSKEGGYLPEAEWKICFDDFRKVNGEDSIWDETEEDDMEEAPVRIRGLYYNHTFSYQEINSMVEGVLATKTLDTKSANELIQKIEENLATKYYKRGARRICKIQEPELMNREVLRENLLTIQRAIDENVQIRFQFNGYTHRKKLEPQRAEKDTVSPYYIVANGGRYYLLACKEIPTDGKPMRRMSIWRIDLMTDIEIPGVNERLGIAGKPRIPKRDVENLPMEWREDFQLKHLNMSFDAPRKITLRIKSEKRKDDPSKWVRADYTFLHDYFGDYFRYVRSEKEPPYDDIVVVECSPYGMVNWALQYSDRVEVLEPEEVRAAVIEKVRRLNEKYGI